MPAIFFCIRIEPRNPDDALPGKCRKRQRYPAQAGAPDTTRRRIGISFGWSEGAMAADRLGYIADMARQLEAMSAEIGCRCLAALLELAQEEALRQRRVALRPPPRRV